MALIFKSFLKRAQGLGSAKSGVHHWIVQRVTAVALIPLSLWFVGMFLKFLPIPYEFVSLQFKGIWNAGLAISFITIVFYHGALGMQVIWEDYIPHQFTKWILIIFTKLVSLFMALLAVLSILKIYLG